MECHRNKCPQELVQCPFAEVGCMSDIRRCQLEDHMTSGMQQHLMMVMEDHKVTKNRLEAKLHETEARLHKTEAKLHNTEAKLSTTELGFKEAMSKLSVAEDRSAWSNKLKNPGDSVRIQMPNFSEYRHSGRIWHSPPFYFREGYKMCLAVYPRGQDGSGTHISTSLHLHKGDRDDQLKWPLQCCNQSTIPHPIHPTVVGKPHFIFGPHERIERVRSCKKIHECDQFCSLNTSILTIVHCCLVHWCTSGV